jgi:ribosomal protein L16/L10AE
MGNGKGNPEYYVAEIQPGKVLYEMDGVTRRWRAKLCACCRQAADPTLSLRAWWVDHESSELRAKASTN